MSFDQSTRNRLSRFVGDARNLLSEEFTRQLQHEYGMDPASGEVADLDRLIQLDDARRETARILRDTLQHYLSGDTVPDKKARQDALQRIVREQAFTVLNRLSALRMMEARGLLLESVGSGYQSRGFQLYARLAGSALGETGDAYRAYLFSLFDEFAVDLAVLFDRFSPQGRLFPRESVLLELLEQINHPDIDPLWAEDETIGWIYQYFNSKEERKAMRDASQAPRNSRELAVRNQFFTPRYVVEFLTDNTLGRIWYEMTRGETRLVDQCRYLVRRPTEIFLAEGEEAPSHAEADADLSQEELLKQPVYVPPRPLKDPRELTMLDPACGSMHFGLYAFDLYETIYDEAWELEERRGAHALQRSDGLPPLHETYPDKQTFLRDVPRLIIERNIHGIDIDPRAVQIAGLSLWLRAQRSWQQQGLKAQERPVIRKSNIVCAEPMPGDKAQIDEFLKGLREERLETLIRRVLDVPENQRVRATPTMADALCELVSTVWHEMELAGEAGSLLKIEESLAAAIDHARDEWEQRLPLFRVETFRMTEGPAAEKPKVNYLRSVPGEEEDFWDRAEAMVLAALQEYAEQAETGHRYTRRLYVADAVQGFAFIDICRQRYDVVLMNPPFGNPSIASRSYLSGKFPYLWADIYAAFVVCASDRLTESGRVGAITSRSFLSLSSFEPLRSILIDESPLRLAVECGLGVLDDATVRACFYVFERNGESSSPTMFLDLRNSSDRETNLLEAIDCRSELRFYRIFASEFHNIPGKPFVYWLPKSLRGLLSDGPHLDPQRLSPDAEPGIAHVAVGASTTDDMRFVRCHWEIPRERIGPADWVRFAHAVGFARYYSPTYTVLNWRMDGRELMSVTDAKGNVKPRLRYREHFFQAGLISPYISERGLGCSYLAPDHIVSNSCRAYFDVNYAPGALLGYLNSQQTDLFVWALTPDRKHEAGIIAAIPVPKRLDEIADEIVQLSRIGWHSVLALRTLDETDPLHVIAHKEWDDRVGSAQNTFLAAQTEIDRLVEPEDITSQSLTGLLQQSGAPHDLGDWAIEVQDESKVSNSHYPAQTTMIVSHCLGAAYGLWDITFCSDHRKDYLPNDPELPLPTCPPGMLQNTAGLPATPADLPVDYPMRVSWSGIMVDDSGKAEDIVTRVREALAVIWPDNADAIEQEACEILGVDSLRAYFANPNLFFADHLKRYSKSRRVAPIYWPLSTTSGSYTLWLYYHRLSDQMLYSCVNDFVDPKLREITDQLAGLRTKTGRSRTEEKELERLSDLELELRDFRAELLRIAAFWKPNLNDGVQISAAPLWKLFQHRQWQKRLRGTWEKLEAGDYDWAHLAMSIWPERVVPKCVDDRSLAIAHDVEDLFWVEDAGKWRQLRSPAEEIEGQKQRHRKSLTDEQRERILKALADLAEKDGYSMSGQQVAQHLAEGDWDDTEVALLFWPERVAEKCLDDPFLADNLRINLPPKRTKAAVKRWKKQLVKAGCPDQADALLASLDEEDATLSQIIAELKTGRRDHAPLALPLYPERVVDQCTADADLAEIHGLRRFFWVQAPDGSCRRRKERQREVVDEIARRK